MGIIYFLSVFTHCAVLIFTKTTLLSVAVKNKII